MQLMGPWVPSFTNAIARHLDSNPFLTFSFATVDSTGSPKVRTCIYRGFLFNDKKTNVITFTTDIRMDKHQHLNQNPKYEACFWFPNTNEQFRFSGTAQILTHENVPKFTKHIQTVDYPIISPNAIKTYSSSLDLSSLEHYQVNDEIKPSVDEWNKELDDKWDSLSRNLKSAFRKPAPGSEMTSDKQKLLDSISRGVDGSKETDGTKNYALVILLTDKVDYVNLNGHQSRFIYERFDHDQWTESEICP